MSFKSTANLYLSICCFLSIWTSTVDTHRKNILKKIQLYGKTDLIRFAIERKYDF